MKYTLTRLVWSGILTLLSISVASPTVAQDQPWVGYWSAPHCSPDGVRISLSATSPDLSAFETTCSVRTVKQREGSFEINADCGDEDGSHPVTLTVRVDGDKLQFTEQRGFEFDPKGFVRCEHGK